METPAQAAVTAQQQTENAVRVCTEGCPARAPLTTASELRLLPRRRVPKIWAVGQGFLLAEAPPSGEKKLVERLRGLEVG